MPRANPYFLSGYVWHITHRCHKGEFLSKFGRDQRAWLNWVFEAKKLFGVSILNYSVTSNHIHLIMKDGLKGSVHEKRNNSFSELDIPKFMD